MLSDLPPDIMAVRKNEYIETILPKHMQNLVRLLGESEWFAGEFSVADLSFYDALDVSNRQVPGVLDQYPTLRAFHARVEARPNIAKYHNSDLFKELFAFKPL